MTQTKTINMVMRNYKDLSRQGAKRMVRQWALVELFNPKKVKPISKAEIIKRVESDFVEVRKMNARIPWPDGVAIPSPEQTINECALEAEAEARAS